LICETLSSCIYHILCTITSEKKSQISVRTWSHAREERGAVRWFGFEHEDGNLHRLISRNQGASRISHRRWKVPDQAQMAATCMGCVTPLRMAAEDMMRVQDCTEGMHIFSQKLRNYHIVLLQPHSHRLR